MNIKWWYLALGFMVVILGHPLSAGVPLWICTAVIAGTFFNLAWEAHTRWKNPITSAIADEDGIIRGYVMYSSLEHIIFTDVNGNVIEPIHNVVVENGQVDIPESCK
jgi:hypothetical protein